MTSIEWLVEQLWNYSEPSLTNKILIDKAKEMHKQEIIEAHGEEQSYLQYDGSWKRMNGEQYYQETFVSKGSDDHISDISKMVEDSTVMLPQQEISDEEIEKSMRKYNITDFGQMAAYITGAKWYREQLKQRK
jgi:hypothetical protein